ncbi:MAG: flagella basal body P-ring formation protein FlgA [Acidobacteria bacterium]|nr:MAG: flagella basal body P-ring formation protein FlgA [Acidobacteriota bacterium]
MTLAALALLAAASGAAPETAALVVRLRPAVSAPAESSLRLSDVADLSGPLAERAAAVALGPAPAAGRRRGLSRLAVRSALERSGVPSGRVRFDGARVVQVTGLGQPVDTERVRRAIERALPEFFPGLTVRVEEVAVPRTLLVPPGDYEVELLRPRRAPVTGKLRLPVEVRPARGKPVRTGVLARIAAEGPQVVARRDVPRGAVLTARDVAVETRPLRPGGPWLASPAEAVGRIARRGLRAGEPVPAGVLGGAQAVEAGQSVVAVYRSGGVTLTLETVARAGGGVGAVVPVAGPGGRGVVKARVVAPGRVEVIGSDAAPAVE